MIAQKNILLTACLLFFSLGLVASVDEPESNTAKITKYMYEKMVSCKKNCLDFAKNHPFITMAVITTAISSKMRNTVVVLPRIFWEGAQEHPIILALIGGFLLSLVVS